MAPWSDLGYGKGPFLADTTLLNLSAPENTAAADPNGCAAVHPSATYAARLLFASAIHERAANGSLAPLATNTTAAAALFSVLSDGDGGVTSADRVVGVAGAPGGNAVHVCVEAAAGEPQAEAVAINCTASAPLSPAGEACGPPIVCPGRQVMDFCHLHVCGQTELDSLRPHLAGSISRRYALAQQSRCDRDAFAVITRVCMLKLRKRHGGGCHA